MPDMPAALSILLLLCGPWAFAQSRLSPALQRLRKDPSSRHRAAFQAASGAERMVKVTMRLLPGIGREQLSARYPRARFFSRSGLVQTAWAPLSMLSSLENDPGLVYAEAASRLEPALDVARSASYSGPLALGVVDPAHQDFGPNLGGGVVIGIVDTGIDFRHPDFSRTGDPSRTRILKIWDQTDSLGPSPASPYGYGTEWTRAQIDAELGASPPGAVREADTEGHGSHVAGIAAGNGSATGHGQSAGRFKGLAPEADILMVKTDFDDTSILDGVNYIVDAARALGRPVVVNLSLSGMMGPHDGTSNFDSGLNAVAASVPIVAANGNYQESSAHASATVSAGGTLTIQVQRTAATNEIDLEFWSPAGDAYRCSVATHSSFTTAVSANSGESRSGSLGSTSVQIDDGVNSHPAGDKQVAIALYRSPQITPSSFFVRLQRTSSGSTGRVDGYAAAWTVSRFADHVDLTGTVGSPAAAANLLSVGSFCSKRVWTSVNGNSYYDSECSSGELGGLSRFSSRGPTRDNRVKPDLAAPGHRIASAMSSSMSPAADPAIVSEDGRHMLYEGTSMAAPVVAGLAALKLQYSPSLTPAQLKAYLESIALADPAVSAFGSAPNNGWGHGKAQYIACGSPVADAPSFNAPSTLGTSSISWTWGAVSGASSYGVYYATNTSSFIASVPSESFVFANLLANTTYGIFVQGVNACGQGPGGASPSTSTLALPLASASASAFQSSVTASFTARPASPRSQACFGYRLEASLSPSFSSPSSSSTPNGRLSSLSVAGLSQGATYYLRLGTLNERGAPNYLGLGSVQTRGALAPPGPAGFSSVAPNSLQAAWTLNGNPPGLLYQADLSAAADFSGAVSSLTYNLQASFSGLSANSTHYCRVKASGGPYAGLGSTTTLAYAPSGARLSAVFSSSAAASWSSGGNPPSTRYLAQLSSSAALAPPVLSSSTLAASASFGGLWANTTYTLAVRSLNRSGSPSAAAWASSATLANAPGVPASPFSSSASSLVARWIPLPASPSSATCLGYRVEASTRPDFSGAVVSSVAWGSSSSSLSLGGLLRGATYYLRAGSLNWNRLPNYSALGSTCVFLQALSSGVVTNASDLTLSLTPPFPEVSRISAQIPKDSLPAGVLAELDASPQAMPPPLCNQAGLTPLGTAAAFQLSAQGAQPALPVVLTLTYDPSRLPAGADPGALAIARYSDPDLAWTLLPSAVDARAGTVRASTRHLSYFAPFLVSAGADLSSVQAFPVPWIPGGSNADFEAPFLTFSGLPAEASVKIFNLVGERLWEGSASPGGILLWDGRDSRGRRAGSGTYLAVISGAGSKAVRRIVVIR